MTNKNDVVIKLLKMRAKLEQWERLDGGNVAAYAGKIYKIAWKLKTDDDGWQAFCESADWKNEKQKPRFYPGSRAQALRFVTKFVVGFGSKSNGNRVRNLVGMVIKAWNAKTPPDEVAAHMMKVLEEKRDKRAAAKARQNANRPIGVALVRNDLAQKILLAEGVQKIKLTVEFDRTGRKPLLKILKSRGKPANKLSLPNSTKYKNTGKAAHR